MTLSAVAINIMAYLHAIHMTRAMLCSAVEQMSVWQVTRNLASLCLHINTYFLHLVAPFYSTFLRQSVLALVRSVGAGQRTFKSMNFYASR